jgi:anti-sigma factor RsiW
VGSFSEHDELAALADGSLDPSRRAALEARVAVSPELAACLAGQRRAVELARGVGAEVEAPAALRARLDAGRRASLARRLHDRLRSRGR